MSFSLPSQGDEKLGNWIIWVNIIALLVLFFSFIGGLKEGAVKSFFSLVGLIIAIPLAGLSYRWVVGVLSFIPGEDWQNFIGFFVTLAIISIILTLIFLLPRKLIEKAWNKGVLFRLIGAVLSIFGAAISMVVFTLVVESYPIFGWLEQAVTESSVLIWLVVHLSFVQSLLPELFRTGVTTAVVPFMFCA